MNFIIRKLNNDLTNTLNASDAPIEAKRIILENLLGMISKEADKMVKFEIRQREEKQNGRVSENKLAEHAEHANAD